MSDLRPTAIILAGGLARRIGGGAKTLRRIAGAPILEHILRRLADQTKLVLLNVNQDAAAFADFGLPLVPDTLPDHPGPLAGLLAGMELLGAHAPADALLFSAPGDAPFLPADLVARLLQARGNCDIACATSGERLHPLTALWPVEIAGDLRRFLTVERGRRVTDFLARHRVAEVEWPVAPYDPFFNVNTLEDLEQAEQIAAKIMPFGSRIW